MAFAHLLHFAEGLHRGVSLLRTTPAPTPSQIGCKAVRDLPPGICTAISKYNPFRAYVWDGAKSIYLGMFPSVAKAQAAQRAFLAGRPVTSGTKKGKL